MSFARRLVIDTGVLVSAAIRPESVPSLAFEKALLHFTICASEETLAERTIASDPHLTDLHPWRGIPIMPPAAFLVAIR